MMGSGGEGGDGLFFRPMDERYALFDLDQTLLPHDTQALFCNYVLRREGWRRVYLLWFLPCLPLAAVRLLSLRTMKRLFFSYLVGMRRETLEAHVAAFLKSDFHEALYPAVLVELERNRAEGRVLILNSASPEFYLKGIAAKLGFDHYLGTDLEIPGVMPFLPVITVPNNKHGAKVVAMIDRGLIPEDVVMLADSWAYSDSSADLPLLELVGNAVMIHPGTNLAAIGAGHGWRTMTPARPYAGKWSGRLAACAQACGLYRAPDRENA